MFKNYYNYSNSQEIRGTKANKIKSKKELNLIANYLSKELDKSVTEKNDWKKVVEEELEELYKEKLITFYNYTAFGGYNDTKINSHSKTLLKTIAGFINENCKEGASLEEVLLSIKKIANADVFKLTLPDPKDKRGERDKESILKKKALILKTLFSIGKKIDINYIQSNQQDIEKDFTYNSTIEMYKEIFKGVENIDDKVLEDFTKTAAYDDSDDFLASLMNFKNSVPSYVPEMDDNSLSTESIRNFYLKENGKLCGKIFALKIKYPFLNTRDVDTLFDFNGAKSGTPTINERTNIHSKLFYNILVSLDEVIENLKKNNNIKNKDVLIEKITDKSSLFFKSMNLIKKLNFSFSGNEENIKKVFKGFFEAILTNNLSNERIKDVISNIDRIEKSGNYIENLNELNSAIYAAFNSSGEFRSFNKKTLNLIEQTIKDKSFTDSEKIGSLKNFYIDNADKKKDKILLSNYETILNADVLNNQDKIYLLEDLINNPDNYIGTLVSKNSVKDKNLKHFGKFIENNDIPEGLFGGGKELAECRSGISFLNNTLEDIEYFTNNLNEDAYGLDKEKVAKLAIAQCIVDLQKANFDIDNFILKDENNISKYRRFGFLLKLISGDKLPITHKLLNNNISDIRNTLRGFKDKDLLFKVALQAEKYTNTAKKQSEFLVNLAGIGEPQNRENFKLILSKFPKTGKKYKLKNNNNIVYESAIKEGDKCKEMKSSFFSSEYREYINTVKGFVYKMQNEPYFNDFLKDFNLAGVNISSSDESNAMYINRISGYFKVYSFLKETNVNIPRRYISSFILAFMACDEEISNSIIDLLKTIDTNEAIDNKEKQKITESVIGDIINRFEYSFKEGDYKVTITDDNKTSIKNRTTSAINVIVLNKLYGSSFKINTDFFKNLPEKINLDDEKKVLQYILFGEVKNKIKGVPQQQQQQQQPLIDNEKDIVSGMLSFLNGINGPITIEDFINNKLLNNNVQISSDKDFENFTKYATIEDINRVFDRGKLNTVNDDFLRKTIVFNSFKDLDSSINNKGSLSDTEKTYNNSIKIADIDNDARWDNAYGEDFINKFDKLFVEQFSNGGIRQGANKKYLHTLEKKLNGFSALELQKLGDVFELFSDLKQQINLGVDTSFIKVDTSNNAQPKGVLEFLRNTILDKNYNDSKLSYYEKVCFCKLCNILNVTFCKADIEKIKGEQDDKKQLELVSELVIKTINKFYSDFQQIVLSGEGIEFFLKKYRVAEEDITKARDLLLYKLQTPETVEIKGKDLIVNLGKVFRFTNNGFLQSLTDSLLFWKEQTGETVYSLLNNVKTATTEESYKKEYDRLVKRIKDLNDYNKSNNDVINALKGIELFCNKMNNAVDVVQFLKQDNDFLNKKITANNAVNILYLINLDEDVVNNLPSFASSFIKDFLSRAFNEYNIDEIDGIAVNAVNDNLVKEFFKKIVNNSIDLKNSTYDIFNKNAALSCLRDFQNYNIDKYRDKLTNNPSEDEKRINDHIFMMKERFSYLRHKVKKEVIGEEEFDLQKYIPDVSKDLANFNHLILNKGERFIYKNSKGDKILIKQFEENNINPNGVNGLKYYLIEKQENLVIYKELKQGQNGLDVERVRLFKVQDFLNADIANGNIGFDTIINNDNLGVKIDKENNTVVVLDDSAATEAITKNDNISFENFTNICTRSCELLEVASKTNLFDGSGDNLKVGIKKIIKSLNLDTENFYEKMNCIRKSITYIIDYRNKILLGDEVFSKFREKLNKALLSGKVGDIKDFCTTLVEAIQSTEISNDDSYGFIEFVDRGAKILLVKQFLSLVKDKSETEIDSFYDKYNYILNKLDEFTEFVKENSLLLKNKQEQDSFKKKIIDFIKVLDGKLEHINIDRALQECQRKTVFLDENIDNDTLIGDDVFDYIEEQEEKKDNDKDEEEDEEKDKDEEDEEKDKEKDEEEEEKDKRKDEEENKKNGLKNKRKNNKRIKKKKKIDLDSIPITGNKNVRAENFRRKNNPKGGSNDIRETNIAGQRTIYDVYKLREMFNKVPKTSRMSTGRNFHLL